MCKTMAGQSGLPLAPSPWPLALAPRTQGIKAGSTRNPVLEQTDQADSGDFRERAALLAVSPGQCIVRWWTSLQVTRS